MRVITRFLVLLLVVTTAGVFTAEAQTTGSSLRGYVKDAQGGALPGVTVTATSPDMIQPATGVTDGTGYYRLINLPPGEFTVTAELAGFSTFLRKGILLRAAVNFQVDITLALGTLSETITVTGESPMLEVSKPGNILNIDGEFQKAMPLAARRNWTDFLEQTPGVHSRPFDDGSGRSVLAEEAYGPAWSPDGALIAFVRTFGDPTGRSNEVWVMAPDGSGQRKLADGGSRPRWSPNGELIFWQGDDGTWSIRPDGSALTKLPTGGVSLIEGLADVDWQAVRP